VIVPQTLDLILYQQVSTPQLRDLQIIARTKCQRFRNLIFECLMLSLEFCKAGSERHVLHPFGSSDANAFRTLD